MAGDIDPKDIPQGAFELYDAYCHGQISRRGFFDGHAVDLYVPGCPTHPLTFIDGVMRLIGIRSLRP